MSSCCGFHEDKISDNWAVDGPILYQENEQNIIFMNFKRTLFIIDSTNYVKDCKRCKKRRRIYLYGIWPNVRVSFDGKTDLPIRKIVHDIYISNKSIVVENEPSLGNFIYVHSINQDIKEHAIIYYPTGNIEWSGFEHYPNICVDGKPVIFCRTGDRSKIMLINSDGEIIDVKVVYSMEYTFNIGNGILRREYDSHTSYWKYITNPALKTKPAARE